MAIDTAERRKSVTGIGGPRLAVTMNASEDLEWRQEVAGLYPGIATQFVQSNPAVAGTAETLFMQGIAANPELNLRPAPGTLLGSTEMSATVGERIVYTGYSFSWPFVFEGSGTIAAATITGNIRRRGSRQVLLRDLTTFTITDAATRRATLALTAANTAKLEGDPLDPTKTVEHVLSVYITESGGQPIHYGPLRFPVSTGA